MNVKTKMNLQLREQSLILTRFPFNPAHAGTKSVTNVKKYFIYNH